jgi:hypothetical protein
MKLFAIAVLCVSLAGTVFSQQSSGLTLEGAIMSASPVIGSNLDSLSYPRRTPSTSTEKLLIRVDLYFRLKNEGSTPLLVLEPSRCYCDKSIEFFSSIPYTVDGETPVVRSMQKTEQWRIVRPNYPNGYDPFGEFLKTLSFAQAPGTSILLIEPGKSYDFRDSITIDEGYHIEWRAGKTTRQLSSETVLADFPAFRVEYRLSVKGRQDYPSLFAKLKDRWAKIGQFVIATEEDIVLRSNPIINIPGR